MGKALGRNDILGAKDFKSEEVSVPEWGGDVIVKGLTGSERDDYESSILELSAAGDKMVPVLENARAKLCVLAMVDEDGNALFTEEDIPALGQKSAKALQRVFDKARELAGLKEDDIKELAQGLKPVRDDSSTSD